MTAEEAIALLRSTWGSYSERWGNAPAFEDLPYLGAEWAKPDFCEWITETYVKPFVTQDSVVIDLGCGGGKYTQYLAPLCKQVIAIDISMQMLRRAAAYLDSQGISNVQYLLNDGKSFGDIGSPIDLVFSYDVFLHLSIELVYSYLLDGQRVLKDGGVFILHQVNILTEDMLERLEFQTEKELWQYQLGAPLAIGRQFFSTPEMSKVVAHRAGYEVIKEGSMLKRDVLLALKKESKK